MIRYLLLQNKQGQTRLSKWYLPVEFEEQSRLENEILTLETIHFLVETLDAYFKSVCEMDIIFSFYKVYEILDNYIVAGEVLDVNKQEIVNRIRELEKLN